MNETEVQIWLLSEAVDFLGNLNEKAREKIYYNIKKAQFVKDKELLKKLNAKEVKTLYSGKAYRLFSFWDKTDDKDTLIVARHGILKKTQKTPSKEIKKAEEIRKQYLAYRQAGLDKKINSYGNQ